MSVKPGAQLTPQIMSGRWGGGQRWAASRPLPSDCSHRSALGPGELDSDPRAQLSQRAPLSRGGAGFPAERTATRLCPNADTAAGVPGFHIDLRHLFLPLSCCASSGLGFDELHASRVHVAWPLAFTGTLAGSPALGTS